MYPKISYLVQLRMCTMPRNRMSEQSICKMGCRAAFLSLLFPMASTNGIWWGRFSEVLVACLFVTAVHCWAKWLCTAACHYKTSCDCTFIPMKHPICCTAGVVPMNTIIGT